MQKFTCSLCGVVENGLPRCICPACHVESIQIRHLVSEMGRRMKLQYADVYLGLKAGINKLVDQINALKRSRH